MSPKLTRVALICLGLTLTALCASVAQRAAAPPAQQAAAPNVMTPAIPWVWGANSAGQLGNCRTGDVQTPRAVRANCASNGSFLTDVVNITGGGRHTLALQSDGTVSAWGLAGNGQLGDGSTHDDSGNHFNSPVKVQDPAGGNFSAVRGVAAGDRHSLAVKIDGTVWAWGGNNFAQIGSGAPQNPASATVRPTPVLVAAGQPLTGATAVAAGQFHSLALKNGQVWAWGSNRFGAVGNQNIKPNQLEGQPFAVPVDVLTDVKDISAGLNFSLALKTDGTVWAWGRNQAGQLGNGEVGSDNTLDATYITPRQVLVLTNVSAIAAGEAHGLALRNGTVWSWGGNNVGQLGLGNNDFANRSTPSQVPGLSNIVAIAAGQYHSLALRADGTVFAWGTNSAFQLGAPSNVAQSDTPLQVSGVAGVTLIASGFNHSLALKPDNITGQATLLDGAPFPGVINLTGAQTGTATPDAQGFYAFGNATGLTTAPATPSGPYTVAPVLPQGFSSNPPSVNIASLSGNQQANFVITTTPGPCIKGSVKDLNLHALSGVTVTLSQSGQVQTTLQTDMNGVYDFGCQPGGPSYTVTPSLVNYTFDPPSRTLSTLGSNETVDFVGSLSSFNDGQTNQNIVWSWGSNGFRKLGYSTGPNSDNPVPSQVSSLVGFTAVSGGESHSIALSVNRTVFAWGNNQNDQLGNNEPLSSSLTPVQVFGLNDITAIAAGYKHNLALRTGGTLVAWGFNAQGAVGDGTGVDRRAPVPVGGNLSGIAAIAAGQHSLALKSDGTVFAWGSNNYGALGTGEERSQQGLRTLPAQVINLTGVRMDAAHHTIAAGLNHSLAIKTDGTLVAWGRNREGQLGNNTIDPVVTPPFDVYISHPTPAPVQGGLANVIEVAAGEQHSLALKADGTVWAWGGNSAGQLGDGTNTTRLLPVQVLQTQQGQVTSLTNVVAIAAGYGHSLAVKADGTVWAWGSNVAGQLGLGDHTNRNTAQQVMVITGTVAIAAGQDHSLATVATDQISGFVKTASGTGLANINVTLTGPSTIVTRTDANGAYKFTLLALHGDYTVAPSSTSFTFNPTSRSFIDLRGSQTADFTATPGQSQETLELSTNNVTVGLLTSANSLAAAAGAGAEPPLTPDRPVLDKRVGVAVDSTNKTVQITPLAGAADQHYAGVVSTKAVNFNNRSISVRVDQAAAGNSDTIFSVGTDKDNLLRFRIVSAGAAAAEGALPAGISPADNNNQVVLLQLRSGGTQTTVGQVPLAGNNNLMLTYAGNQIIFSTSPNGTTWNAQAPVPAQGLPGNGNTVPVAVEVSAGTRGAVPQPGSAGFSNLNTGPAAMMQLSAASYSVSEGVGRAPITVTRSGDLSSAVSVKYRTVDSDTFRVGCADTVNNHGAAYGRCDFATSLDTLNFAPGESQKTLFVPIIDDDHVEGNETFQIVLDNPAGAVLFSPAAATVTIVDNDTAQPQPPGPTFQFPFFIRQHYLDFLAREPDAPGFNAYLNLLNGCPDPNNLDPAKPSAACDRIAVSNAFFGSDEFRLKGLYVILFYSVAFGQSPQSPSYAQFVQDLRSVTGTTPAETFAKRAAFATAFTQLDRFKAAYDGLSNDAYVATLMGRYNLSAITTPDPQQPDGTAKVTLSRTELSNRLSAGTLSRAQVLRAVAQSDEVGRAEAINAFVASQFYGYLRRTPDTPGFNAWVNYLTAHPSDFRTMVNGFVNSSEYRLRFGALPTQ